MEQLCSDEVRRSGSQQRDQHPAPPIGWACLPYDACQLDQNNGTLETPEDHNRCNGWISKGRRETLLRNELLQRADKLLSKASIPVLLRWPRTVNGET